MDNIIQRNGNGDEVRSKNEKLSSQNLFNTLCMLTFQATNDRQPPPPTPIAKNTQLSGQNMKKEKRGSSSRFNVSKNRELTPLPRLTGE